MSSNRRFGLWVLAVACCFAAAPLRLAEHDGLWLLAAAVQTGGLVLMLALLVGTPPDAIKLRPETSWTLIMGGVWLNLACATPTPSPLMLIAAGVLAVLVPVGVWSMVLDPGASPWWVVLVGWSPALPTLVARQITVESTGVIAYSWGMSLVGLIVAAGVVGVFAGAAGREEGGGKQTWRPAALILGITTLLSGFVPLLS